MICYCCVEDEKMTLQSNIFFDLQSTREAPTYRAFSPFQFASNKCQTTGVVDVEFFSNFSCTCKRISLQQLSGSMIALNWLLSTSDGWPLHFSSSRLLSPLQNFLNHHCMVHLLAVPGPNVLLML